MAKQMGYPERTNHRKFVDRTDRQSGHDWNKKPTETEFNKQMRKSEKE